MCSFLSHSLVASPVRSIAQRSYSLITFPERFGFCFQFKFEFFLFNYYLHLYVLLIICFYTINQWVIFDITIRFLPDSVLMVRQILCVTYVLWPFSNEWRISSSQYEISQKNVCLKNQWVNTNYWKKKRDPHDYWWWWGADILFFLAL